MTYCRDRAHGRDDSVLSRDTIMEAVEVATIEKTEADHYVGDTLRFHTRSRIESARATDLSVETTMLRSSFASKNETQVTSIKL